MHKYAGHVFDIMSVRIISVTSSTNTGHGNEFRVEFKICDCKSKTGLLVEETEKIKKFDFILYLQILTFSFIQFINATSKGKFNLILPTLVIFCT